MNYRHSYHAGNFADVIKHIALVTVILHLRKKETPFSVLDSHGGRGAYDLSGSQAAQTGEAKNGIGQLLDLTDPMPEGLSTYLSLVKGDNLYPGSPLIAAKLLRPQDRLIAIEKQPDEFAFLKETLKTFRNASVEQGDGYSRIIKLLPPPSRRGVVLLDPPFESPDEFSSLAKALREGYRRFANGIYLAWYPVKARADVDAFLGEALAGGIAKAIVITTSISTTEGKLSCAGLLVVNPPFGFDAAIEACANIIQARLAATIQTVWIAGQP